jgi:hypothetical protein
MIVEDQVDEIIDMLTSSLDKFAGEDRGLPPRGLTGDSMSKIIITCAVTGSIHTPSMSPYLPVTAEEIAEQAIGAAKRARRSCICMRAIPATGRPSASGAFHGVPAAIKQGPMRC